MANLAASYEADLTKLRSAENALNAQIERVREQAEMQAAETLAHAVEQQETLLEGIQLISNGELCIESGRWTAPTVGREIRVRLNPLLKYLRPIYDKLAGLVAMLMSEREALARERHTVALQRARAAEMISDLETVRSQLSTDQAAKLEQARDELNFTP